MNRWHFRPTVLTTLIALLCAVAFAPVPPAAQSVNREVSNTADSGVGTLRQAMLDAQPGDTITFNPSTFPPGSPAVIFVLSVLPTLSRNNVTIDASNAGVILDGSLAPGGTNGFIVGADGCIVRGLTIRGFSSNGIIIEVGASGNTIGGNRGVGSGPNGQGNVILGNGGSGIDIRGAGADGNLIRGNIIGIDGTGMWAAGNAYNGVAIWQGARSNTVGGSVSGHRNVIGGNNHNGVWIGGAGTDQNVVIGNYLGTRADGLGAVSNRWAGVAIQGGAQNNRVGGIAAGEGNLISGNGDNGVLISDVGTSGNQVLGNIIGPDRTGTAAIGQGTNGVHITLGASGNAVGNGSPAGRNVISANTFVGVRIAGSDTVSNTVQGNYMGTNISGTLALPNGLHGGELADNAHDNLVGGDRLAGQGNVMSGNLNHGLVVTGGAHHNTVSGNIVGPDATGSFSLGNHPYGGIDIAEAAHHNTIGGLTPGAGNLISGNQMDGIALFDNTGFGTTDNQVLGNLIGMQLNGVQPLPNGGDGIFNVSGAYWTTIQSNTVAYSAGNGVFTSECAGNTITQNSIYSNTLAGIRNTCLPAPQLTVVTAETITGTTVASAHVEFFVDDEDEGRQYLGFTTANATGVFTYTRPGGFPGPNVTATSTNVGGTTSAFSAPAHVRWTVLIYLNGDNDLDEVMRDVLDNLVAAGPSPRANVLVLHDGYTSTLAYSGTVLYDATRGQAAPITTTLGSTRTVPGELNMGDAQMLVGFVEWGQAHFPAHYTLLAIVDHGGGWAPSNEITPTGSALARRTHWLAGNSGLSWDFSDGYDYLDSPEMRQAMAAITSNGSDPLDVVFYDVCLMGMLEVAYQIKDYADYFVVSQNIAWAPIGPQGRYVQLIQGIAPDTAPRQMAELLVDVYARATPPEEHPFTVSAVDLSQLPAVTSAVSQLADAISGTLDGPSSAAWLAAVYTATQKFDYDSDFSIEPATDGFVDVYDFAVRAAQWYTDSAVLAAARSVTTTFNAALVAEQHRSGAPWLALGQEWDLSHAHGLSIFLPLGEDLELPILITETSPITPGLVLTRNLRLRDRYSSDQLQFVGSTVWPAMIDAYYVAAASPVPTDTTQGPVGQPLTPDIAPPQTIITLTGTPALGQIMTVTWMTTDTQSMSDRATLWHRPPAGSWMGVFTQTGSSGAFVVAVSMPCRHEYAVRAIDKAGNVEPIESGFNTVIVDVPFCTHLPILFRASK